MDDMILSWPLMAAAFHPWLPSASKSHWEDCIISLQSLFRMCPLPWTTTTHWRWSIVLVNFAGTRVDGCIHKSHFSSVRSGLQKIKLRIVKLLLISVLSSFPFLFFSFFLSSFLQPCLHCLMVISANWRHCDIFMVFGLALLCPASWHFLSAIACLFGNF